MAIHPSRSQTSVGIFTVETVNGPLRASAVYGCRSIAHTASAIGSDGPSLASGSWVRGRLLRFGVNFCADVGVSALLSSTPRWLLGSGVGFIAPVSVSALPPSLSRWLPRSLPGCRATALLSALPVARGGAVSGRSRSCKSRMAASGLFGYAKLAVFRVIVLPRSNCVTRRSADSTP